MTKGKTCWNSEDDEDGTKLTFTEDSEYVRYCTKHFTSFYFILTQLHEIGSVIPSLLIRTLRCREVKLTAQCQPMSETGKLGPEAREFDCSDVFDPTPKKVQCPSDKTDRTGHSKAFCAVLLSLRSHWPFTHCLFSSLSDLERKNRKY